MKEKEKNFCDKYLICSENKTKNDTNFATILKEQNGKTRRRKTRRRKMIFLAESCGFSFRKSLFQVDFPLCPNNASVADEHTDLRQTSNVYEHGAKALQVNFLR